MLQLKIERIIRLSHLWGHPFHDMRSSIRAIYIGTPPAWQTRS
ncbi:hypothetical protein CEV34_3149 [Brucella pseudogrignonensis]|uniref:Uncharacterized protein n=1 Tax=Brucella pseudogrignonensis TaxID=419475 RepID=A0A256GAP7_9HYPH|nr:hypothetical protein CEV34_3149 [Brucella pseudogrignonensis]